MPRPRTCNDCYFRQRGLCALACERPCPTFRLPVDGKLVVPRQAQLIPTNDAFVGSDARELVAAS
jgi:hypothetical protein